MGLNIQLGSRKKPDKKVIYVKDQGGFKKYLFYFIVGVIIFLFRKQILILIFSII
jgi:hypothetical protein